jgi:phosphatidylethanolamine-binding protein (PEBP) family uncharacterized protein
MPSIGYAEIFFKVYAVETKLDLGGYSQKRDVEKAMESHVLAKGELVGLYSRKTT